MKRPMKIGFALLLCAYAAALLFLPETGRDALRFSGENLLQSMVLLVPVFICVGLLEVWVSRETVTGLMGESSGLRGVLLSFAAGIVTAVPFYALLPVAGMLLGKGCSVRNVLLFLGASTGIRIPLLLFEAASLGWKFTLARLLLNVLAILLTAFGVDGLLSRKDKARMLERTNLPE